MIMSNMRTVRDAGFVGAAAGATIVKEVGSMAGEAANAWASVWAEKRARDAEYIRSLPEDQQEEMRQRLEKETIRGQIDSILILFFLGAVVYGVFKWLFY